MERIGKGLITSVCAIYLNEIRKEKITDIAAELEVNHATVSKWKSCEPTANVKQAYYARLLDYLESYVQKEKCESEFTEYLVSMLKKHEFDEARCREILNARAAGSLIQRIYNLETDYSFQTLALQRQLNIAEVLSNFRRYCWDYSEYISVLNNSSIQVNPYTKSNLQSWIYFPDNPEVTEPNYVILSMPYNYRIAVILTNHNFEQYHQNMYFLRAVQEVMKDTNLQMLVIFTDQNVSAEVQHAFHREFNGCFVNIRNEKFHKEYMQYMINMESDYTIGRQKAACYAHYMFRKFLLLFPMLRDEIVFHTYQTFMADHGQKAGEGRLQLSSLADHLVRDVYHYDYLTRHTIYFERQQVASQVDLWLENHKRRKMGIVVELNFASALISSAIEEKCEKIMLVDWSKTAHDYVLENYLSNRKKDKKYEFHLAYRHMDTISERTQKILLREKADLVIVSMGNGSNTVSLVNFLRHINEWLSPNGMLYISFINAESVLFQRQNNWLKQMNLYSQGRNYVMSLPASPPLQEGLTLPMPTTGYHVREISQVLKDHYKLEKTMTYPFLSASANTDLTSPVILSAIREIDKKEAENGKYGHLIMIFGTRQSFADGSRRNPEEIQKRILELLKEKNVDYRLFEHASVTTKEQLRGAVHVARSNQKNNLSGQYQILKTVILQDRETGAYYFHVLPVGQRIEFDNTDYSLMREKEVTSLYGAGIVSPLVTLHEIVRYTGCRGKIMVDRDLISRRAYVIFSSGLNTASIWMKSADLLALLETAES